MIFYRTATAYCTRGGEPRRLGGLTEENGEKLLRIMRSLAVLWLAGVPCVAPATRLQGDYDTANKLTSFLPETSIPFCVNDSWRNQSKQDCTKVIPKTPDPHKIAWLHIPKCGTSFRRTLVPWMASKSQISIEAEGKRSVAKGFHFPAPSNARDLVARKVVCLFREPVQRLLSAFHENMR